MTHNDDTNYFGGRDLAPANPDRGILLIASILGTLTAAASIIILFS